MSADADAEGDADPMEDAEAWQALDRDEQSAMLDEGLADLRGDTDGEEFRHLDDDDQRATLDAIERDDASETEQAMQAAMEQTWTAEVFEGLDDVPTVPFECHPLTASQRERLDEVMQLFARLGGALSEGAAAEEAADLSFAESEYFDDAAEAEAWLLEFLADITVDEAFDEQRWREGPLRDGTRSELLAAIYTHVQEEAERAMKFRTESGG